MRVESAAVVAQNILGAYIFRSRFCVTAARITPAPSMRATAAWPLLGAARGTSAVGDAVGHQLFARRGTPALKITAEAPSVPGSSE
jgi:hypothetical protein